MQVTVEQLFSRIGRLLVEVDTLTQANAVLVQGVAKLQGQVKSLEDAKQTGKSVQKTQ